MISAAHACSSDAASGQARSSLGTYQVRDEDFTFKRSDVKCPSNDYTEAELRFPFGNKGLAFTYPYQVQPELCLHAHNHPLSINLPMCCNHMGNSKKSGVGSNLHPPNCPNAGPVPFLSSDFSSVSPEKASTFIAFLVSSQTPPAERPYSPATEEESSLGKNWRNKCQATWAAVSPPWRLISSYEPMHRRLLLT